MKKIVKILLSGKEVLFAFLFGSAVRERTSKLSDIDIGVYLDHIGVI